MHTTQEFPLKKKINSMKKICKYRKSSDMSKKRIEIYISKNTQIPLNPDG